MEKVKLKKIKLENFKSYKEFDVDFTDNDGNILPSFGFFGPNGSGKSTIIMAIGVLFENFEGRYWTVASSYLRKFLRNVKNQNVDLSSSKMIDTSEILNNMDDDGNYKGDIDEKKLSKKTYSDDFFKLVGTFVKENGVEYDVVISNDKEDWICDKSDKIISPKKWHPKKVVDNLNDQCFFTRYDVELNKFSLKRSEWDDFKKFFEKVSGFKIEENSCESSLFKDPLVDKYVLSFKINKPHETIVEKQASDGEKKIIKNYSTILNKDKKPSIILIDNVEMHVHLDRHALLLKSIEECFPESQIIYTTHSESLIKDQHNFPMKSLWKIDGEYVDAKNFQYVAHICKNKDRTKIVPSLSVMCSMCSSGSKEEDHLTINDLTELIPENIDYKEILKNNKKNE